MGITDREFLVWLHKRLVEVHGEDERYDYMSRLRSVIYYTPPDKGSPSIVTEGLTDLMCKMAQGLEPESAEGR